MALALRYGAGSTIEFDLPAGVLAAECPGPRDPPLHEPEAAVAAALREPLNFPALSQATVPGDAVAIALEEGVPQSAAVAAAAVNELLRAGIEPSDITLLRTPADEAAGAADPRERLPPKLREQVALVTHDPENRDQLGFLGSTKKGQPIYLNRHLCEADVVLPLGCQRLPLGGEYDARGGVYPAFSDAKTRDRFRTWELSTHEDAAARARREAQEVSWQLGTHFTLRVVPGAEGQLLRVLAGEVAEVAKRGGDLCQAAWSCGAPRRAALVVAAIDGDASQQTWHNVGRALAAAGRLADEEGTIAICCELAAPPGPAVKRLAHAESPQAALRQIRGSHFDDSLAAMRLAQALDRGKVYLLSRLDENVIEDLGMAAVADGREIARLASRHSTCILLASAQFAAPIAEDD